MSLPERPKGEDLRTQHEGVPPNLHNRSSRSSCSSRSIRSTGTPVDAGHGDTPTRRFDAVRRRTAALSVAALSFATLTLAACSTSAPIRYYSVESVPPMAASGAAAPLASAAYDGPPLQVRAVRLPPANDRPELTSEVAPGEWQIRDFDHWIAPLDRLARQALSEDLAARLPPGRLVFPGAAYPPTGADLTVDILSFELRDGVAKMVLSYTVRERANAATRNSAPSQPPMRDGAPSRMGAQLRLQTTVGEGAGSTSRAWSRLLGQLADQVAARLSEGGLAGGAATR